MIRALSEPFIFFTVPFAIYLVWLAVRFTNPFAVERWTRRVVVPLALTGLTLALGTLILLALTAPRYEGGYVPAHLVNGRVVPGQMQ